MQYCYQQPQTLYEQSVKISNGSYSARVIPNVYYSPSSNVIFQGGSVLQIQTLCYNGKNTAAITLHSIWKLFYLVFSYTFSLPEMLFYWNYPKQN